MEKFSNATQSFYKTIKGVSEEVEEVKKDIQKNGISPIVKALKVMARPELIPMAAISYGLKKTASIKEDISISHLRDVLFFEYGAEWLDWAPGVIEKTMFGDARNDLISNKIQAIRVCLSTDTPWLEWHIFENVGKAFNHQIPDFSIMTPLSLGECEVAMQTMRELREEEFANEVLIYVASIAFTEHYVYMPKEWEIGDAQEHLDTMILDPGLRKVTEQGWNKISKVDVLNEEFKDDDPVHVQLANLTIVQQYVKEQLS